MQILDWRNKSWRDRAFLIATVMAILLLASHPELRLLIPLIDAVGLDFFFVLIGAQAWTFAKPPLLMLYQAVVLPLARNCYSAFIFLFGCDGPYVDATISARFQRHTLAP